MRHGRHLPLRRPAPGGLAAAREPPRCHIVTVRTATLSHRGGCGAVTGAAAARREGPPSRRGGKGQRGGRGARGAAAGSSALAGNSLHRSLTHSTFVFGERNVTELL